MIPVARVGWAGPSLPEIRDHLLLRDIHLHNRHEQASHLSERLDGRQLAMVFAVATLLQVLDGPLAPLFELVA